ncbi:hypothetical protein [Oscillibacter sp.]|uniref:rolling circle replication-associated protein n=1 Tax=Oscillibacter sp. TaxID=1945593 RepID=UPI00289F9F62|nr:hypothetical protein [Oscillibacter sp.]
MYTKMVIVREKVTITQIEKLNLNTSKAQQLSLMKSDNKIEINKKYHYNQLRKRRELEAIIEINFKPEESCFCTLTFADRTLDFDAANHYLDNFLKQMRRAYSNFKYVLTIEFQKDGLPHYHLICNIWDETDAAQSILRFWKHGSVDVELSATLPKLISYMTKTFPFKKRSSYLFGKRSYKASQRLNRPIILKSWEIGVCSFYHLKSSIISGSAKWCRSLKNESAGQITYEEYKLNAQGCNTFLNDYIFSAKSFCRKRLIKLQNPSFEYNTSKYCSTFSSERLYSTLPMQ